MAAVVIHLGIRKREEYSQRTEAGGLSAARHQVSVMAEAGQFSPTHKDNFSYHAQLH
jgi:hypothetical protein